MKILLPLCLLSLCTLPALAQFQFNYGANGEHYHDLNIERLTDGSNDLILAGNLFDATMTDEAMILHRITETGSVVWAHRYTDNTFLKARCFDVVTDGNFLYATGSVDVAGVKKVFLAQIDPSNGNVLANNYYEVGGNMLHGRGLKVSITNSDATGDGLPNPGLVVAGFYSACYQSSQQCAQNTGFVLRTDLSLGQLWTASLESGQTGVWDFDMANGLTETSNGFVITGSTTGDQFGLIRQAVLACKIDFEGNLVWNESYRFGNARDVSADAYYDAASDAVYVLCNYSNAHYFGVTVFDNASGSVDLSRSWYSNATDGDLDRYGFAIHEAPNNANNLLITAYDRVHLWTDTSGINIVSESSVIVYEFEKSTGDQVNLSYQYLVPHQEPLGDEFSFWFEQMPLIYYPDISYAYADADGNPRCFQVGYRSEPSGYTEAELFSTVVFKRNECEHLVLNFLHDPIVRQAAPLGVTAISSSSFSMGLAAQSITPSQSACGISVNTGSVPLTTPVRVYPNPASHELHLESEAILRSYQLINAFGRPVMHGVLEQNKASLNIHHLPAGLYFLRLETANKAVTVVRFVKQK